MYRLLANRKHSFQNNQSFETGFSDHHHLIYTVLKTTFVKVPPKVIKYRNYKHFSDQDFRADLANGLCKTRLKTYDEFEEIVRAKQDKHAPLKTAIFRGNNKPHVSKELKKAIMARTRLKNKSDQTPTEEDFCKYKQQRNLVVRLNRVAKRKFFSQLDPKEVGKETNFWKTFKPLFTDKTSGQNKIVLVENENIVNDDKLICEIFNSYFVNITDTLPITAPPKSDVEITSTTDRVLHSIQKYGNHPSIIRIKENVGIVDKFEFNFVAPIDVWNKINQLNSSKKPSGEISTDILKLLSGLCIDQITFYIDMMFECSEFPDKLKLADVSPRERRRRGRGNGHSIDFRCMMRI